MSLTESRVACRRGSQLFGALAGSRFGDGFGVAGCLAGARSLIGSTTLILFCSPMSTGSGSFPGR